MVFIHRHSLRRLDLSIPCSIFETGINTLYIAFLRKEKCFRLPPINRSSDTTYRMAAANIPSSLVAAQSTSVY